MPREPKENDPDLTIQRITLDLPRHMLAKLDAQADYQGITRQALIKTLLHQALEPPNSARK